MRMPKMSTAQRQAAGQSSRRAVRPKAAADLAARDIDARLREAKAEVARLEAARDTLIGGRGARAGREGARGSHAPPDPLDSVEAAIERAAVAAQPSEMAAYLQEHLGQRLTAYLAGLKDVKRVGQWARGTSQPPAVTRERLRAAFHATQLLLMRYSDDAVGGWFFGANSSLDDRAPAAVLREAEAPDELALVVPLARAFVRGAH
jgi:hypothetical protein